MTGSRTCSTKVQKEGARLSEIKTWLRRALHARLSEIDFFSPSFFVRTYAAWQESQWAARACAAMSKFCAARLCPRQYLLAAPAGLGRPLLSLLPAAVSSPLRPLWSHWLGAKLNFDAACHAGRKNEKLFEVPKSETSRTHGWPRLRFYNVKTPTRDGPHTVLALQRRAARQNGAARLCTRPKGTKVAQRDRLRRTASSRTRLWAFCPSIPLGRFRVEQ